MTFVIGTKKEMTQLFKEDGTVVPVTIVEVTEAVIAGLKTIEKDGYNAIVVGYGKKKNSTKPEQGKFKALGFVPRFVTEFRTETTEGFEVGKDVDVTKFTEGSKVDVTGVTKGKGFQGVIKRWGFHGGPKTHGQSDRHRAPGSIGAGTTPGRVLKGKKMAGHMGAINKTVKNLELISVDSDNKLLIVKGAVPGVKGGFIKIKLVK